MAGTMPPPTRGRPYYDVARGRKMVVPKEGGKAIPFVGEPAEWTPRRALRRAGIRATAAGDRAARRAPRAALDTAKASGGIPQLGVGQLVVYVFVSIIALALLENVLGGPGSGAVSKILAFLGGTITRLVSPTDPIVPQGVVPPPAAAPASSTSPTSSTAVSPAVAPGNSVLGLLGSILRVDQGVDFQTVGPVPALASGVVSHVSPVGSWAGGTGQAVYVTLDTPVTIQGRTYSQIYYAERLPLVTRGQRVTAGLTPVIAQGSNELGFANGNQPASPPVGGIGAGTKPSQAGQDFLAWLKKGGKP